MADKQPILPDDPLKTPDSPSDMEKGKGSFLKALLDVTMRYVLPLGVTVLLVWFMFKKVSFRDVWEIISHGVNYWWILLAMGISIVSHIARAARWRLQLRGMKAKPKFLMLCCSIFGTYGLNLLFPRLGEVWRCAYVSKNTRLSFTRVLGSMVADRLSDTITVALLLLFTFIVASRAINAFITKFAVGESIMKAIEDPWLWIGIAAAVLAVAVIAYFMRHTKVMKRVVDWIRQIWKGFAVIGSMEGKGMFLLLTAAIWGCYFLQLYVAFFAFDFTRELVWKPGTAFGLEPCLVAWVLSSIGMAIPSNGGLGPWNIACMFGLAIYGISEAQGTAFSILVWSAQTVMLFILGIFTMGYIMFQRRNKG